MFIQIPHVIRRPCPRPRQRRDFIHPFRAGRMRLTFHRQDYDRPFRQLCFRRKLHPAIPDDRPETHAATMPVLQLPVNFPFSSPNSRSRGRALKRPGHLSWMKRTSALHVRRPQRRNRSAVRPSIAGGRRRRSLPPDSRRNHRFPSGPMRKTRAARMGGPRRGSFFLVCSRHMGDTISQAHR